MSTNVGDKTLRSAGHLLVLGSCLTSRFPEIVEGFLSGDHSPVPVEVCLEETHMNMAGYKLASIVSYAGIDKLTALTIDGSPHCVQLHYLIEDIKRHFAPQVQTAHFVVEKGETHSVSPEAVKQSRHLHRVERTLSDSH
ncbi:MAG: hypothetical protein HXY34_10945 [Candidatus Thorarchaeota archaeon]|nr:hypothetical protein [Candidatus Thorarchaeota archaeon]